MANITVKPIATVKSRNNRFNTRIRDITKTKIQSPISRIQKPPTAKATACPDELFWDFSVAMTVLAV
jgi:hypothetical protein